MTHAALLGIATVVLGLPLMWLSRRGLFGSRNAYVHAQEELREHGRAVLSPPMTLRMLGAGPLVLDANGLTVHQWRSKDFYAWADMPEPFTLQLGTRNSRISFQHRRRNGNYGKRKLFRNTRDEYVNVRRTITSAYAMGWDNLLGLLNEGRTRLAVPPGTPVAHVPPPAELQGDVRPPMPRSSKPAVPGWAIKSGLGIAVVAALGFMLSAFSWSPGTATAGGEPAYAYGGGDGGGGPGPVVGRPSNINPEQHVVQGYTRSNGMYVAPHMATNPDHDRSNNLSSRGNTNPYTGARGHR